MWLVKFFNPSCRPCQRLEPYWKIAASELKGRVNLGMVDIIENPKLAHKYGVQEVPTIKYFSGSTFHAEEYTGGLTANNIVAWAMKRYIAAIPIHSSALKLEKKCNFKNTKTHFLHFQKWQKVNFCTRKKFKTTKNPVFSVQKLHF